MEKMILPNCLPFYYENKSECMFLYNEIFRDKVYNSHGLILNPEKPGCIFDIGANIGMSMLYFHDKCPGTKVYGVEPNPSIYEILSANIELNGINAKTFKCALSNKAGRVTFTSYPGKSALSGLYADPDQDAELTKHYLINEGMSEEDADYILSDAFKAETYECELRTLSEIIHEEKIERIKLLKIDVEKAEMDVLMGIKDDHWSLIKQIAMEVHSNQLLCAVKGILADKKFKFFVTQNPLLKGTELYDLYATAESGKKAFYG